MSPLVIGVSVVIAVFWARYCSKLEGQKAQAEATLSELLYEKHELQEQIRGLQFALATERSVNSVARSLVTPKD